MYRSRLAKKLKPAKTAWKSFTTKLRGKLHTLNIPETIKTSTQTFLTFCSRHLFIPFQKRFLSKPSYRRRPSHQYNHFYHNQNQLQMNFSPIYIDHLYSEPQSHSTAHLKHAQAEASRSKQREVVEDKALPRKGKQSLYSVEDAWEAVVASSPQLRCVDERAEEFIYKFREDMKIERERSLLEFQEMLARSA